MVSFSASCSLPLGISFRIKVNLAVLAFSVLHIFLLVFEIYLVIQSLVPSLMQVSFL